MEKPRSTVLVVSGTDGLPPPTVKRPTMGHGRVKLTERVTCPTSVEGM
jgi:hypothetical protein